jgi:hypothetical protein
MHSQVNMSTGPKARIPEMTRSPFVLLCAALLLAIPAVVSAQEAADAPETAERAEQVLEDTRQTVESIAQDVDKSQTAQEVSAGILKPIYLLAEHLAFPMFHWVAFALMAAGVVGFALQLVLAKLVVLSKFSFSLREILSDAIGLAISLFGLVLTTQAAAENSTFTQSPALVLSAAALGILVGFLHYRWGQSQELAAVEGRRKKPAAQAPS